MGISSSSNRACRACLRRNTKSPRVNSHSRGSQFCRVNSHSRDSQFHRVNNHPRGNQFHRVNRDLRDTPATSLDCTRLLGTCFRCL